MKSSLTAEKSNLLSAIKIGDVGESGGLGGLVSFGQELSHHLVHVKAITYKMQHTHAQIKIGDGGTDYT